MTLLAIHHKYASSIATTIIMIAMPFANLSADRGPPAGHGERVKDKDSSEKGASSEKSSTKDKDGRDLSSHSRDSGSSGSSRDTKSEPIGVGTFGWDLIFAPEVEQVFTKANPLLIGGWLEYYLYGHNFYLDLEGSIDHTIHNGDDSFLDFETYLVIGSGSIEEGYRVLGGPLISFVGSFCSWHEPELDKVWFKYLDLGLGYGFQRHRLHDYREEILIGGILGLSTAFVDDTDTTVGFFVGPHFKFLRKFNRWVGFRFTLGAFFGVADEEFLIDLHLRTLLSIYLLHNNLYLELGPQMKFYRAALPQFEYGDGIYQWVLDEPEPDFGFIFRVAFNLNFANPDRDSSNTR